MKLRNSGLLKFDYAVVTVAALLFTAIYGCHPAESGDARVAQIEKTASVKPLIDKSKKRLKGAACCKVSFSRSKMLSLRNSQPNISPSRK